MGDRVAEQVAQRLGEPVGVGEQRARGQLPKLVAARREQGGPVPELLDEARERDRLDAQELGLLGLGEQQEVVNEAGDAERSPPARGAPPAGPPRGGLSLGGEHLQLAADHGERGAQLVRGVRDERALARERVGEAVEHVVEGVREHPHLLALALDVMDARVQIAGVHLRRHRSHSPQRSREARADQQRSEQRTGEREQAREDERPRNAALRVCHARQGLPHPDRHLLAAPSAACWASPSFGIRLPSSLARDTDRPLEQAQATDVGEAQGGVPVARAEQPAGEPVLLCLHRGALAIVGRRLAEQLRRIGGGPGPGDEREQQRRARVEGLPTDVAAHRRQRLAGGTCARGGERVGELVRVARDLTVDLVAQLGARSAVDRHERDAGGEHHDQRHPPRQPPAQAEAARPSPQPARPSRYPTARTV